MKDRRDWFQGMSHNPDHNENNNEVNDDRKYPVDIEKMIHDMLKNDNHDVDEYDEDAAYLDEEEIELLRQIKILVLDVDGVLTDGTINIAANGELFKGFNAKDGLGISIAQRQGIPVVIMTGRRSEIVHRRAEELGIRLVMDGIKDKGMALAELCNANHINVNQVGYMGDDLNDLPAIMSGCVSFAPADASEDVLQEVDFIMNANGGRGAVREAIELILKAQDKWHLTLGNYLMQGQGDLQ